MRPADAGVVRTERGSWWPASCAPRGRGGGPDVNQDGMLGLECAPRTRRGPGTDIATTYRGLRAPRTRGWSLRHAARAPGFRSAPRGRGGGPKTTIDSSSSGQCAPRTRGWSFGPAVRVDRVVVRPA